MQGTAPLHPEFLQGRAPHAENVQRPGVRQKRGLVRGAADSIRYAEKWFNILPKHGQWENTLRYDRKKRRVILNGMECQ
jgi:hypothetical protein